jgi:tRNA splicing ligase
MMNRELFFATPIYVADVGTPQLNKHLEHHIIEWSKKDKGLQKTNMNGWHSETNMHKLPEYIDLVDLLFKAQFHIYKEELLDNEPFLGNMWATLIIKVVTIDHICILIHYGQVFIILRLQKTVVI